jgi:4-hydroxyphenylacetate 3-monooxygenase
MRTGKEYIEGLRDGRTVYVYGDVVSDVPSHRAFAGVVETAASLYDISSDPANHMTYTSPETGNLANKAFLTPRSREDLRVRREAITKWADVSKGFLGRSPDHVASFFAGFASGAEVFDREGRAFGDNVRAWHRRILDDDLFLSYVIIPPQVSRMTTAHGWEDEFIQVGAVEERDDGIVVRGSQMLGTSAAISDHIFVSCIKPLTPDDTDYALSFIVPAAAPGLRLYCRRPYAVDVPSRFDYPMSSRFDETDAFAVFDDVFVPWENVFVYKDVAGVRSQFFETAAHVLGNTQAQIRLVKKMQFLAGVTRKIASTNQIDAIPSVQEKLGELASLASIVEGMVIASEATSSQDRFGVERPNPRFLYGSMGLQAEIFPRTLGLVRELAGGGVMQLPSSYKELVGDETRGDMERYVQSPGVPTTERVKLFKLVWDLIGSEFAGRHQQYEMFYAGAPFVAKGYSYRNYGYDAFVQEVDAFLAGYEPDGSR